MADRTPTPHPQRQANRLHHEILVAYRTMDGFITDWAVNISKGGLFVNTRSPLAVGSEIRLIVSLPSSAFPFDLQGKVTWVNEFDNAANLVPGMGIEFIGIDDEQKLKIAEFVEKLRLELPEA
jgi:uncharacterized protein (TIGR02266 family)